MPMFEVGVHIWDLCARARNREIVEPPSVTAEIKRSAEERKSPRSSRSKRLFTRRTISALPKLSDAAQRSALSNSLRAAICRVMAFWKK